MIGRILRSAVWLGLLLVVGAAAAAEAPKPAAEVAAVSGSVTAVDPEGEMRSLKIGDPVRSGDIVTTGPGSSITLTFSDGGSLFLRPRSRFRIDDYRNSGDAAKDRSFFSLLRGGFRAVTGAIGGRNKEAYKIETPVATIGIRGTDHEGRYCQGDCVDLMNQGVQPPADGLYTGTHQGATTVGGRTVPAGQYTFTNPQTRTTQTLPGAPPILSVDNMPNPAGAAARQRGGDGNGERRGEGRQGGQGEQQQQQGGTTAPAEGGGGTGGQNGGTEGGSPQGGEVGGTPPAGGNGGEGLGGTTTEFELPAKPPGVTTVECVR